MLASLQGMKTPRDLPATSLQGIQSLVALLFAGLQGIKPLEPSCCHKALTLKTVLGVHKIYHACLFFNVSLALLRQTL